MSQHFCFIHQGVRYPTTTPPSRPQPPPQWTEIIKQVLSHLKRKIIPGTQRPEIMSPQDIKLDYKVLLLPATSSPWLCSSVFSWQRAVTRERPPVWQALWTLPLRSTQDCRRHSSQGSDRHIEDAFIFVTLWVGRRAQSLHVSQGIFN